MAECVQTWCGQVAANNRKSTSLVVSGCFGCGKTQALRDATRYVNRIRMDVFPSVWPVPLNVMVVPFPKFCAEVLYRENHEIYEDVCVADVVFIDDIGAEEDRYRSGAPTRMLGDLLGALEGKFTFITTNVDPDGWRDRWDGRVQDRLLRRNAVVCNLFRPQYRSQSYAQFCLTKGAKAK